MGLAGAGARLDEHWLAENAREDDVESLELPWPEAGCTWTEPIGPEELLGDFLGLGTLSKVARSAERLAVLKDGQAAGAPRVDVISVHEVERDRSLAQDADAALPLPDTANVSTREHAARVALDVTAHALPPL